MQEREVNDYQIRCLADDDRCIIHVTDPTPEFGTRFLEFILSRSAKWLYYEFIIEWRYAKGEFKVRESEFMDFCLDFKEFMEGEDDYERD